MNRLLKLIPRVKKLKLILIAALVWFIAGVNVFRLGIKTLNFQIEILNILIATIIFVLFYKLIFSRMVIKHTNRIIKYESELIEIYKFFDAKSYFIMFFMITFGSYVRKLNIIPFKYLGSLYLGIGTALLSAAVCFLVNYKRIQI